MSARPNRDGDGSDPDRSASAFMRSSAQSDAPPSASVRSAILAHHIGCRRPTPNSPVPEEPIVRRAAKTPPRSGVGLEKVIGAGDGNRTHDIQLGKLTFYL